MLPILATQLAQIGMGTIDTLMSGHVSTRDLAAVAVGTSVWLPVWLFLAGILVAVSPLAANLNAAINKPSGQRSGASALPDLLATTLFVGLIAGILAGILLWLGASFVNWLIDDPVTARISADYLLAIALGFPAVGVFLAYRYYAEALNQPIHVTGVMLIGLLANIPLNAVFVYGWFGLPEMGGVGCGIASSLVFVGMAFAMARNTRKHRIPAHYALVKRCLQPDFAQVRKLLRIGVPIGLAIFFEVSLFTTVALFLTDLGPVVVAGHQVAINVSSLTFMVPLSLGMSLTVRVGHYLGSDDPQSAKQASWLGVRLNLALAVVNALLITFLATPIATLYSPDHQVVQLAASLLLYAAVFQLSDATQVAAAGALRAYHDTFVVMLITFIAYWPLGMGSGYLLAFHGITALDIPAAGAQGFWTGLIIGLSCAAIALTIRLRVICQRTSASSAMP
nr:MATE family efflux transporter [Oceanobacter mangrovi]